MKLTEQTLNAQKTENKNLSLNGIKYALEVKNPFWMRVNIENVVPKQTGDYEITASKLKLTQTDIVPKDTIFNIIKSLGKDIINLGGKIPKRLVKINENNMKKVVKLTEKDISNLVKKVLKEQENANYMFFSNLHQMKRQIEMLLDMDESMIDTILTKGHDWADDHISEAKTNLDQVFDFIMNEKSENEDALEYEDINESKKKSSKLCARGIAAAKAKYDVYPSAYANGYAVQVCKGKKPGTDGKKRCSGSYC